MTLRTFCIPTLTRCVSIDANCAKDDADGRYQTINGEGFLVRGDPYGKSTGVQLNEFGTKWIEDGFVFVFETDVESALSRFFRQEGTKTGLAGKGSSQALQINQTLPIVELPKCKYATSTRSHMAPTPHGELCSMNPVKIAVCSAQRAFECVANMKRKDWNTFVSERISVGGRGGQGFAFISAETLTDHPLFTERMEQKQERYAST